MRCRDQRRHAGDVVRDQHVQLGLVALAGDDDDGYPLRQAAEFLGGHELFRHEQAIDLAGQRADPLLKLLAAAAEAQQQGVPGPAQHELGRVHDLVDEQYAVLLDIHLGAAALQGGETDDVLPAIAESLGIGIRDEIECLDHREHALARVLIHQRRPAHDPGHRGRRNTGHPGDVVDGRHLS